MVPREKQNKRYTIEFNVYEINVRACSRWWFAVDPRFNGYIDTTGGVGFMYIVAPVV